MIVPINADRDGFKDFRFYDIEVFQQDTLIVFKNLDKSTDRVFHNNFNGLEEYISDKILVGYNNYYYDDFILSAVLNNYSLSQIKGVNDTIIGGSKSNVPLRDEITSLDCFQQINVAKSSLKKVEANLGMSIDETEVPFDIKRALTDSEYELVLKYCKHDVDATIDVFKLRWKTYFVPKLSVIEMLKGVKKEWALRWNTTTITAQFLTETPYDFQGMTRYKSVPIDKWFDYRLGKFDLSTIRDHFPDIPQEIVDIWKDKQLDIVSGKAKLEKFSFESYGCTFEFGFGGLHGVNKARKSFKNVKLLDVASMYPNIIINLNALGGIATKKYKEIVETRLRAKHEGDTATANALKLVINSAYGLMKNEYSKLYNPIGGTSVCIFGQIALFELCRRLYEEGYTLVNINTDGVAFTGTGTDYLKVQKLWEKDFGMTLELSEFSKWVQKDVNNYIAENRKGYIKVKGADVSKFNDPTDYKGDLFKLNAGLSWTSTNTLGIISRAVVDFVLNSVAPEITVARNTDKPILYQFILQAGRTYLGTFDEYGNKYQNVNRVFAGKQNGVNLMKVKEDGSHTRFANVPERLFVFNDDLAELEGFRDRIDLTYYNKLAREVCERWK